MAQKDLNKAKTKKNDVFYTPLVNIEREVKYYRDFFKNKVVYCNCDGVLRDEKSNFFIYFALNYKYLGLKGLICTAYNPSGHGEKYIYLGDLYGNSFPSDDKIEKSILQENGCFNSDECLKILQECDVVVTNPPFSLFREFIHTLISNQKKFLVIGNQTAVGYTEIFPLLQNNKIWLGVNYGNQDFIVPNHYSTTKTHVDDNGINYATFGNICWFTNIYNVNRSIPLELYKTYTSEKYKKYDNFNAINVNRIEDIPCDYDGVIGVPITFMNRYCPEQFEIIGQDGNIAWCENECKFFTPPPKELADYYRSKKTGWRIANAYILNEDGEPQLIFRRIFIRRKSVRVA